MKPLLICLLVWCLSGCGVLANQAAAGHDDRRLQAGVTTYTTAEVRTITRRAPLRTGQPEVVCTEPTPDVAMALSTAFQASAKGNSSTAGGEVGVSQSTAEALAELGGRSTALLALRDGLFRTCEAYANGSIGSAAYALVLSRYGQLMTTLFLAEDIRGSVRDGQAAVKSPAVSPPSASPPSTSPGDTPAPAHTDNSGTSQGTPTPTGSSGDDGGSYIKVATTPAGGGAGHAATPDSGGGKGGTKPGTTPNPNPSAPTPTPPTGQPAQVTQAPAASATAAAALTRMNEDYFALDIDLLPQLLVACINEFDPTVIGGARAANTWLQAACNNLNSGDTLQTLLKNRASLQRQVAPQVDPGASASSGGGKPAAAPGAPVVSSSSSSGVGAS